MTAKLVSNRNRGQVDAFEGYEQGFSGRSLSGTFRVSSIQTSQLLLALSQPCAHLVFEQSEG